MEYHFTDITLEAIMDTSKVFVIISHAFVGWALCAATMGVGRAVTSLDVTLIIHAIAAPIFFAGISLVYFQKFNYTSPLLTACIFVAYAIGMDLFVIALLINHSLGMFTSLLGTWIPFALIFASTWLVGRLVIQFKHSNSSASKS
jgi:hypothetical protein